MLEKISNIKDIQKMSNEELHSLADEVRNFLIENVSKTGGHLASNLGIVEITLALLHNFDFNKDKIIFDVGHQSYVYKILTGRKNAFHTLRQYKGISGFPKLKESKYDFFETGHSSTSISAAIGMARARDLKNEDYHVIALIGDGALTGGMVYEALNDIGYKKTNLIILLNDNEMSISQNVGGLSNYLNTIRISSAYNKLKENVHLKLDRRKNVVNKIKKIKNAIKSLWIDSSFFENMGIRYIGPIDGHDIKELNKVFQKTKNLKGPIVIHMITKKGIGYEPALLHPKEFHAIGPFDVKTGKALAKKSKNYSQVFGNALCKLANVDDKVVVITAAMTDGTGLSNFRKEYPHRFFDIGIAEEHATTFAAGLAISGLKPVFAVYSTFLQRSFDQILHDVCIQNLNVTFAIDRAGLVGSDGETHQGMFDLSYLSLMPNMTIVVPKCMEEMDALLHYSVNANKPVAIRYPKGGDIYNLKPLKSVEEGKWEVVSKGKKVAILAVGKMVGYAMLAKEKSGLDVMVINAMFVKPLDKRLLKMLVKKDYAIMTLEDNTIINGFGAQVLYALNSLGYHKGIKMMGIEDRFIEHGSVDELFTDLHMNVDDIVINIKEMSNE